MKMIKFEGAEYPIHNPNADRLGIANLASFVRFVARVIVKVRECAADGRYSWLEVVSTAFTVSGVREFLTGNRLEAIVAELLDLNSAELEELFAALGEELGLNLAEAQLFFQERVMPLLSTVRTVVGVFR
jgi:hypothetical protein